ncbi:MAG: PQQ-binding-like beta-propeller repeat protein [Pirellulaceae bacterium]
MLCSLSFRLPFGPYTRSVILAATLVVHAAGNESSWPTQFHDNQRSSRSAASVALPLSLHWSYQTAQPPRPSWPDPAKQDFWNRKQDLLPRVTYDRAFHLVSDGQCVLFGSSADDQIRCLDLETGQLRWRFFAEAPIRCAPTLHQGHAYFGADDGFLYSINIASGGLKWKTSSQ